jgi:hypothetical protein
MSQQFFTNGETGDQVRAVIDANFGELYAGASLPIKIENTGANQTVSIAANTYIESIALGFVSGSPTISIGTTPGGTDILNAQELNNTTNWSYIVQQQKPSASSYSLYFTISGGNVNIRVNQSINYF